MSDHALLEVDELRVRFAGDVEAVRGVSFALDAGESLAVVGESGSGKSTLAACLLGLIQPPEASGSVRLAGQEVLGQSEAVLRSLRWSIAALALQGSPFNPVVTVGAQIGEPLRDRNGATRSAAQRRTTKVRPAAREPAWIADGSWSSPPSAVRSAHPQRAKHGAGSERDTDVHRSGGRGEHQWQRARSRRATHRSSDLRLVRLPVPVQLQRGHRLHPDEPPLRHPAVEGQHRRAPALAGRECGTLVGQPHLHVQAPRWRPVERRSTVHGRRRGVHVRLLPGRRRSHHPSSASRRKGSPRFRPRAP